MFWCLAVACLRQAARPEPPEDVVARQRRATSFGLGSPVYSRFEVTIPVKIRSPPVRAMYTGARTSSAAAFKELDAWNVDVNIHAIGLALCSFTEFETGSWWTC